MKRPRGSISTGVADGGGSAPAERPPAGPVRPLADGARFRATQRWRLIAVLGFAFNALLPFGLHADTIVERVFHALRQTNMGTDVLFMVNIAENTRGLAEVPRELMHRDSVVIGYDMTGQAIYATATELGVTVSPEQAAALHSGLAAGFYPVGSQLYSLPPGAQVSLFDADAEGRALEATRELLITRIDARVTTAIGLTPRYSIEELDVVAAAITPDALQQVLGIGTIQATALGAVNAGVTTTHLEVTKVEGPIGATLDTLASAVSRGVLGAAQSATTRSTHAIAVDTRVLDGPAFMANLASNEMVVTAAIATRISDRTSAILEEVATAVGAVNSGMIAVQR